MYYVAHRLFAAHDRVLGAVVAEELAARVGAERVFLPFCDTAEDLIADPEKGRLLFEMDRERLERIDGMIAILHGPSLDDGVCMEIGFARRRRVPVVVLTTDFQTYAHSVDGVVLSFPDPLVETVASAVVRAEPGPAAVPPGPGRFTAYREHQEAAIRPGAARAVGLLLDLDERRTVQAPLDEDDTGCEVFVEPWPFTLDGPEPVIEAMADSARSISCARRHRIADVLIDPFARARADWDAATTARTLVVDLRGPETPPGAAVLVGAFAAVRGRVVARRPPHSYTLAPGREPNYRNLMIQYAVETAVGSLDELRALFRGR